MNLLVAFILVPLIGIVLVPFLKVDWKGIAAFSLVLINALLSGYVAIHALMGESFNAVFAGSLVTGSIPLRMDALSAWFILIINLVFVSGGFYGLFYMKAYRQQANNLSLHSIALVLLHASIVSICVIQNSFVFLLAWEMMALTSFLVIIFDHEHISTLKAGINFLIQAHFSILFLMVGFIWVASKTGSYDFNAITVYTASLPAGASLMLYIIFFTGFGIKAGMVPFHTWLPYAHPAAPSHVSGIMSGVIIKIGIFGMLRMLLLVKTDMVTVGYFILILSVVSGLYGVMLAIVQHNLKKLLAYHSIENIGIIGIGIGLGCIGAGHGNHVLATLGFAGALLHTLNHSIFKSLLFYAAGNVYQATHTMNIEKLGGLVKRMPQTAFLFMAAAIAICGLPPFNGFISEFIIYTGLYQWLPEASLLSLLAAIFSAAGLALTGGLAMLCFTKAFGIVFLGTARSPLPSTCREVPFLQLLPMYLLAACMLLIGTFPMLFIHLLSQPVSLFTGSALIPGGMVATEGFHSMEMISRASWILILAVMLVFGIRNRLLRHRSIETAPTWGCGYTAPTSRIQYTAGSFVRTYSKLFAPFLMIGKHEENLEGIFPSPATYHTHPYDKLEKWLIDNPLKADKSFMGRFVFLQNGKLQFYILYGILFILAVISIPLIYENIQSFVEFLTRL